MSINLPFTDEEQAALPDVVAEINSVIQSVRYVLDNPDSHTKDEIASSYANFLEFFETIWNFGRQVIETSIEIDNLTEDPLK